MFDNALIFRLFVAAAIIVLGLLFYQLVTRRSLSRARVQVRRLPNARPGVPMLLYFTTPTCAPCKTIQRPAIHRLQQAVGDRLQVIEIDAASQSDLAGQWGVMSVPTTFILDADGEPVHVNHGVTPAEKLLRQVQELI